MRARSSIALILGLLFCAALSAAATPLPSGRYDYRVSWNGIPAGTATVEVSRDEREPFYRVEAAARTAWLVDWLWSLRAHAAAKFTADELTPLGFRYERDVNRERSVTVIDFHPPTATGTYRRGDRVKSVAASAADVLDPITAIFRALSTTSVHVGKVLSYGVFTGEADYQVELTVTGEETLAVGAGTFKAWRVVPRLWKNGRPEARLHNATIWVSQEPSHVLLRIRSEIFIGAVTCDLQRVGPPSTTVSSL